MGYEEITEPEAERKLGYSGEKSRGLGHVERVAIRP